MLVRLPRAQHYVAQVKKEQTWLPKLAPSLPTPIPAPLAMGEPGEGYPWRWSVFRWIPGEAATHATIASEREFAAQLAGFLSALHLIETDGGPPPGAHNFFRGGSLATYDDQTRQALAALREPFDPKEVTAIWDAALASEWTRPPVWVHGDFAAGNLLISGGRLSGVIDFGTLGVGDPACDLAIAWTTLSDTGRDVFRSTLSLDAATWARGRGWAAWKALILLTRLVDGNPRDVLSAADVLAEVIADHRRAAAAAAAA
jgi:aminoglycoside phosphotransferase (APT) family kinase protein